MQISRNIDKGRHKGEACSREINKSLFSITIEHERVRRKGEAGLCVSPCIAAVTALC